MVSRDGKFLLRQVKILQSAAGVERVADVLITDDYITAIEAHLETSQEVTVIDSQELVLGPGLIDLYSHSGEPGYEQRETFRSLAAAADAGGFTRLSILPDTIPSIDNPAVLALLQQQAASQDSHLSRSPCICFWGALTIGIQGQQMTELTDLGSQVIGFADGQPVEDLSLLHRLLEYLKPLNKPVALVPIVRHLQGNGVVREGIKSFHYGLPGDPDISESAALATILELVALIKTPVHIMRVSTRRGVELIANAKACGLPVTASTTWMHLLLDTEAVKNYDPNLRLEPPLGNQTDREALSEAVKNGVLEAIAIDHTPYTYEEKTVAFAEAPPGAIGLELALPLLWQRFVATGEWSALTLWQALSDGPQRCLQQEPIRCAVGQKAELVLFDPQQTWTVEPKTLKSRCANTPWLGKQITGRVARTWNS